MTIREMIVNPLSEPRWAAEIQVTGVEHRVYVREREGTVRRWLIEVDADDDIYEPVNNTTAVALDAIWIQYQALVRQSE